ncbi:hypothetical protein KBC03_02855 [Patescibacteria group bacterium]|nr:hypothetical protein [Patescibacteria group bacterium]
MNKKTLAFAGIASLIGLSAISLVSANNTSGTLTTNAKTSTTMGKMFKEGK